VLALVLPIVALVNVIFVAAIGFLVYSPPRRKSLTERNAGENPRRRFDDREVDAAPEPARLRRPSRIRPPHR
jgi:hypothetical protein